jgi:hypothetical protein
MKWFQNAEHVYNSAKEPERAVDAAGNSREAVVNRAQIEVVTNSPHYPRSNGLVERNVQTIKRLLKESNDSKQDAFLALLEFRNSPISGMEQSPAELLMSRKLRAKLPIPKHLLKPKLQPGNDVRQRLRVRQLRQKAAYDQGTKQLSSLQPKESVRIRQGGVWNPAVVVEQHK